MMKRSNLDLHSQSTPEARLVGCYWANTALFQ